LAGLLGDHAVHPLAIFTISRLDLDVRGLAAHAAGRLVQQEAVLAGRAFSFATPRKMCAPALATQPVRSPSPSGAEADMSWMCRRSPRGAGRVDHHADRLSLSAAMARAGR